MRWLSLPSSFSGEDWREVSLKLDEIIFGSGWDLADESVYLLYDADPERVLKGEAHCKIARSVIGPKKDPGSPFDLFDWKAATVFQKPLEATSWDGIFTESMNEWKKNEKNYKVFMLCIRRRMNPALSLETEAIFAE
jgi:hypothetical protein